MKIGNFNIGFNFIQPEDIILGINSRVGECEGCGNPVHQLRLGLIICEFHITIHNH